MNTRIKKIRKSAGLTQEEFGKRIGSARNTIANYETGNRNPSNAVIASICREYNINEEWLRTGQGEMKKATQNELSDVLRQIAGGNDEFIQDLVMAYMDLDDVSKQALNKLRDNMLNRQEENLARQYDPFSDVPDTPEEFEAKYPPVEKNRKDIG